MALGKGVLVHLSWGLRSRISSKVPTNWGDLVDPSFAKTMVQIQDEKSIIIHGKIEKGGANCFPHLKLEITLMSHQNHGSRSKKSIYFGLVLKLEISYYGDIIIS